MIESMLESRQCLHGRFVKALVKLVALLCGETKDSDSQRRWISLSRKHASERLPYLAHLKASHGNLRAVCYRLVIYPKHGIIFSFALL
jgi:hypothetical protein